MKRTTTPVPWDERIAKAAIDYWSAKDAKTRAAALARYQGLQAMRELEEHRATMAEKLVDHAGDKTSGGGTY